MTDLQREGNGAAGHIESSEARLMVSKPILPSYHWVVRGLNGSNGSETYIYIYV